MRPRAQRHEWKRIAKGLVALPRPSFARRPVLRAQAAKVLAFSRKPQAVSASQQQARPVSWVSVALHVVLLSLLVVFLGPALLFGPTEN